MASARRVNLDPIALDKAGRWMARADAYEVDGEIVPFRVEIRWQPEPCHHFVAPQDQDPSIEWEPRPDACGDHCWPPAWPGADSLPPGGLPVRLLRHLRLSDFVARHRRAVQTRASYVGTDHPRAEVREHFRAVLSRASPTMKSGRPPLDRTEHLRRLAALEDAYAKGQTRQAAVKGLGITQGALRLSLEWARGQQPPLWTRSGRGRRGHLTPAGRSSVDDLPTKKGRRT